MSIEWAGRKVGATVLLSSRCRKSYCIYLITGKARVNRQVRAVKTRNKVDPAFTRVEWNDLAKT